MTGPVGFSVGCANISCC